MSMRPDDDDMMMGGGGMARGGGGGGGGGGAIVNQVILIGRLGSDPIVKYLDSGNCVLEVSLAVSRPMNPNRVANGDPPETDWIRVVAWGRTAEEMAQSAQKGSRVMVVGRITTNSWTDKYGQNRSDFKVTVNRVEVLQSSRASGNAQQQQQQQQQEMRYYQGGSVAGQWDNGDDGGGGGGGDMAASYGKKSSQQPRQPAVASYGGGGGGGTQFEVEDYDVDTDIPF